MKILKYVLLVILGLIILFFIIGLLKPSVSYGHEVSVNKSVKEAWAVSQDDSRLGQWLKGFKSIDLLSGEKGKVGSTYKVVVNPGNSEDDFEMIETVTSVKEFDHVSMHFDSDFMDFDQTISFSEEDGVTKIKTESKSVGKNMMSRSMFALMEIVVGAFTKQEAENLNALKKLIEENTKNYYPEPIQQGEEL